MTAARQWRRLVSATWVTAGIGLVATSCSFLFELDANQCRIDEDCEKFAGELPVCDAGLCVAKSSSGGNGGSSTAGTAGAPPADAGAGGVGDTGCKSNQECLDATFEPQVCIEGECVGLITDECPLVIGEENLAAEAPIIFGAYTLANAAERSVASRNIDLAVAEFTTEVIGLPGGPNNTRRTLAFVVCNSSFPGVPPGTITPFEPSLAHLIDTLHVPGILSGLSAKDMHAVFSQRLEEAGTFVISPYEQDSELAKLSDGGRLWHLLGATEDLAPTYGPLLQRTEAYLRKTGAFLNLDADDKLRVAIVTANIARETDVRDALLELPELDDFHVELFAVESALLTESPDTESVALGLLDYAPNIIVALAGSEFIEDIFPALEAGTSWGAVGTPTRNQSRPIYLLGAAMAPQTWFLYSNKDPMDGGYGSLLNRMVGVAYESAEDTELLDLYTARLMGENKDLPDPSILIGSENVYDAAYLLIYAAAAAGEVPELNGAEMSSGMRLLLAGEPYNVGPKHISPVLNTLQTGGEVGLRLTMGEPDWNAARGTRKGRGSVYCFDDNGTPAEQEFGSKGPVNDVLRYDPENNTLYDPVTDTVEAELLCIPGF